MSPFRSSAGPGRLHERHLELGGDDLRERGLAEARRPGQQQVVERVAARAGGLDRDGKLLAQALLPDEVLQAPRPQRAVELVLGDEVGRLDARRLRRRRSSRRS